ncbi:MAG: DUF2808 domain-containing protein [Cyanothece sp. SIO1E1]|nr:DUF2808 domain-containing protein [Cyanothece sp. SIO1E1]
MQISSWLSVTLVAALGVSSLTHSTARAVQLADGLTHFERPPSLIKASTPHNRVAERNAGYYFDLRVHENAGEPLQKVVIAQENGNTAFSAVDFDLAKTRAYFGSRRRRGEKVRIDEVTWDGELQAVIVNFNPPIAPGTDLTLRLHAYNNPGLIGVYLFGVTAFPAGEETQGQFIGFGRLQFFNRFF